MLWPLALPFTLLNVAGFMHRSGPVGRVLRAVHGMLCLAVTSWFAAWLLFGGQEVVRAKAWSAWVGVVAAGATATVVILPSLLRCGWESGHAPRRSAPRSSLENPAFFRDGRRLWTLHVIVLLASAALVGLRADADDQSLRLAAQRTVVDVGAVVAALIAVLLLLTLMAAPSDLVHHRKADEDERPRSLVWMFVAVGTAGAGCALVGGLFTAVLRVLVGSSLHGTPYVVFDVYGIAILAGLAVGGAYAVAILGRRSPGEELAVGARVLPDPVSWIRGRVALLPRALAAAVAAAVLSFMVIGAVAFVQRAPASVVEWEDRIGLPSGVRSQLGLPQTATAEDAVAEATWQAGASPPVRVAHFAIYGLFAVMFLNLARSWGSARALRRVGSVWDVLAFWPRRFHPFAVRPYTACAVDQLRELLFVDDSESPDGITVVAHSQGSMLVLAALTPMQRPGGQSGPSHVDHLVTVGSPLRSLYMKAFPAYVSSRLVENVTTALAPQGRWTNVFRFTDHVGRTVFCDEQDWRPVSTPPEGELQDRWWRDDGSGRRSDCCIADPDARQAKVLGHNGYWEDARVRKEVQGAPAERTAGH